MSGEILKVKNLGISYGGREIVHGVSFEVRRGEIFLVVGESGSGKTTILKAIAGLLSGGEITGGEIFFSGRNITRLADTERRKFAGAEIGYIFQNATASFCPIRRVGEQIFEAVRAHKSWSRADFLRRAKVIMQNINLDESALEKFPFQLSGGMGQRAGILAAMILEPKMLLADEPTSALDPQTQAGVIAEFLNLRESYGVSIIMVTHNLEVARKIAEKILILREGVAVEYGAAETVFKSPQQPYTRELLAASL